MSGGEGGRRRNSGRGRGRGRGRGGRGGRGGRTVRICSTEYVLDEHKLILASHSVKTMLMAPPMSLVRFFL